MTGWSIENLSDIEFATSRLLADADLNTYRVAHLLRERNMLTPKLKLLLAVS